MPGSNISFRAFGCCVFLAVLFFLALPADSGEKNKTDSEMLFDAFSKGLRPESMVMILDGEPDENGRVRRIYLDFVGCYVGQVRIDRFYVEALDVTFTPPSIWNEKEPEVRNVLLVRAKTKICEDDVKIALRSDKFNKKDDNWHDIQLNFRDSRAYVSGYKKIAFLDIFFELQGRFDIRHGGEVWLADYSMRINRLNAPESLTEKTISRIQPLIDLGRFPFPLTLRRISQERDYIILESRVAPESFEGTTFLYKGNKTP